MAQKLLLVVAYAESVSGQIRQAWASATKPTCQRPEKQQEEAKSKDGGDLFRPQNNKEKKV